VTAKDKRNHLMSPLQKIKNSPQPSALVRREMPDPRHMRRNILSRKR